MSRAAPSRSLAPPDGPGTGATPRQPIALARRFYQIATAVAAELHDIEDTGLRHLEFRVLVRVHDTPGLDQNSLAQWMALDRTSISALVFRLEQQGLIERAVNGADRRARVLRLTRAGRALHDRIRAKAEAAQQQMLSVLALGGTPRVHRHVRSRDRGQPSVCWRRCRPARPVPNQHQEEAAHMIGARGLIGMALVMASAAACGRDGVSVAWPSRPVKVMLRFGPGSGTDIVVRLLAPRLSEQWGQPVVVDNRPGGDGIVASRRLYRRATNIRCCSRREASLR